MESTTQQQMLARLREAVKLVESDLAGQAERLHELFSELADRSAAFELVQRLDVPGEPKRPASFLTCAALAAQGNEPAGEFLLIPFGEVAVERPCAGSSFVFTRRHADSAVEWFNRMGRKLAIDYEHQSFDRFNTRSDGLRPAAGWIGGLEIRDDGLWATNVAWTDRARELLRAGEYRYFSPVIFWTDEDQSDLAGLGPVALTNDPAMRGVQPLAASRRGNEPGSDDEALDNQPTAPCDPLAHDEAEWVPRAELAAAEAEMAVLERQLAAQVADAFVERGLRAGKVLDSTSMDWRDEYLRDAEKAEERLARAPVLLPPGRMLTLDRRGEVLPLAAGEREFRRHTEAYRRWGVGPEDLAAYDQAVAAGRVLRAGAAG